MNLKFLEIKSIVRRFMVAIVPFSMGGIVLLGVSAFYITKVHITKSVQREIQVFGQGASASVSAFFRQRQNDIETLAETSLLADYYNNHDYGLREEAEQYRREMENHFQVFSKRTAAYARVLFVGSNGREICRVEDHRIAPPGDGAAYAGLLKKASVLPRSAVRTLGVTTDPKYGPIMTYFRPVRDAAGGFRGVLVLEASLKPLQSMLNGLRVGNSGAMFISDSGGAPILTATGAPGAPRDMAADFSSSEPIAGTDFRVVLLARMADFDAPLNRIRRYTVLLSVFSCLLVALFVYFMIRALTRPVKKLVEATEKLAKGGAFEKVEITNRDEIGVLAESFNSMAAQLTERRRELEARIRELLVLQSMSGGVIERLEEENICRLCLEAAAVGIGFERGVFYLINKERTHITGRYVFSTQDAGFTEDQIRQRVISLASGDILAEVARTKKAVIVDNPFEDPRVNKSFIKEIKTKTFCLVPVMTKDKVLGIMGVDNYYTARRILPDQINRLMLFCNFTAIALENANLVADISMSEARYRTVLDNSLDAIFGLDNSLLVTVWNKGAQRLFGYSTKEMIGRPVSRLFEQSAFETIMREIGANNFYTGSCVTGINSFGKKLELDIVWAGSEKESGGERDWTVVIRDTSEQRKIQAQLIQAEKLSAVGQLISGVAHELNNPLAVIVGYSQILHKIKTNPICASPEEVGNIYEAAMRCSEIIKNLLAFVRESRRKRQAVSVPDIAASALTLMSYKLKKAENIAITQHAYPHVPPVMADYHQIEQILVNLIQNACDALSETKGTKKIHIDVSYRLSSVFVTVADNGPGMTPEVQTRIFDPFFTTKEEGHGTGLGLAICRRIAEDHGAKLTCSSVPGRGTKFTLELPIVPIEKGEPAKENSTWKPIPGKKVLVVDDEKEIVAMLKRMLEPEEQVVDTAFSGPEAIEKLKNGSYDLVICDVEMGAEKGFSVLEAMLELRSQAGFIFTTGNYFNPVIMQKLKDAAVPFLTKPFTISDLFLAMSEARPAPSPEHPQV